MNDPFSYSIDPVDMDVIKRAQMPQMTRNLPNITPSYEMGGGMDPVTGAMFVKGGLDVLGSILGAGERRRQQRFQNRMQEEALGLQRQQFGLQQKQYQDQLAQMRARSEFMRPVIDEYRGGTGRFAPSQRAPTALRGYMTGRPEGYQTPSPEDYIRRAREMNPPMGGGQ